MTCIFEILKLYGFPTNSDLTASQAQMSKQSSVSLVTSQHPRAQRKRVGNLLFDDINETRPPFPSQQIQKNYVATRSYHHHRSKTLMHKCRLIHEELHLYKISWREDFSRSTLEKNFPQYYLKTETRKLMTGKLSRSVKTIRADMVEYQRGTRNA
ncbi:hypothetical protein NC651_009760 [Populus alba x Populus x berolinensis]|nr:hypothetical protein NC651_009760 [Populus alba x Populus x berolinensis]